MPKLPVVNGRQLVKFFCDRGYYLDRQRGSHVILDKPGHNPLSIPNHRKPLRPGTLKGILNTAGVSRKEFIEAMRTG